MDVKKNLEPVKYGILLSLCSILFGIAIGVAFGAVEDTLKAGLKNDAQAVLATVYKGDQSKATKTYKKAWSYYKRAHLHAGAMGLTALAISILLLFLSCSDKIKLMASTFAGLGACGYPLFWLLSGIKAPGMGSTHLAKESLSWLAIPSTAIYSIGIMITFLFFLKEIYCPCSKSGSCHEVAKEENSSKG